MNFGLDDAGDFFKDLQEEFQSWEANASSQGKPKSLWEELAVSLNPLHSFSFLIRFKLASIVDMKSAAGGSSRLEYFRTYIFVAKETGL